MRSAVIAACLLLPLAPRASAAQMSGRSCTIAGIVSAGATPLPGVALTLVTADGHTIEATSTAADGTFVVRAPAAGSFVLSAELVAFATVRQPVTIDGAHCDQRTTVTMLLASRAGQQQSREPAAAPRTPTAAVAPDAQPASAKSGPPPRGPNPPTPGAPSIPPGPP